MTPARRTGPGAVLHGLVSARTWLAFVHLIAGFLAGLVTFTVLFTLLVTSVSLMPVFLAGIPMLAGTLWVSLWMAYPERGRFAVLLGNDIPAPPPRPMSRLTGHTLGGPAARHPSRCPPDPG